MIPHVDEKHKDADEEDFDQNAKAVKWHHQLLLSRPLKVVLLGLLLAIVGPILIYNTVFLTSIDLPPPDGFSIGSCLLPRESRLLCGVGVNISTCHPQCCYDMEINTCFHRFPSRFTYIIDEDIWAENATLRPRIQKTPFGLSESVEQIKMSIDEVSPTHLSVTFYNSLEVTIEGQKLKEKNYTYSISTPELNVLINDTAGNFMFNTARGPIIAADNIWEISFKLTDKLMYGLGEIPLEENMIKVLHNHENGWNGIPLIFSKANGTYHGFLVDIPEPTELRFAGDNQIVLRSITTSGIKFHVFCGPEPEDIMRDVITYLGFKNQLQYWMLGAHICSEFTTDPQEALTTFLADASKDKLPFDSHCGLGPVAFDDGICEGNEGNSYKEDVETGARLIRANRKRFIPHVSPYIFYKVPNTTIEDNNSTEIEPLTSGTQQVNCSKFATFEELMLRTNTTGTKELYLGEVANKTVVYPDYSNATDEFMKELWLDVETDGVILENNWPLDETLKRHNETYNLLPYFNKNFEAAFNHTPQWNVTRPSGETYIYEHNKYGNHFANSFRNISGESTPIWSSSQWMSGDVINSQNVDASWVNLQKQMTEAALGSISGHWLWSSPVCGDTENYNSATQASLCVKWYMASTYLPLIKIHSKSVARDPLSFSGTHKAYVLDALNRRQSLLPYFYTTLQKGPLLRPMFYQFPWSDKVRDLKTQFSVGDDLLIAPNLLPSQSHVHITMPPGMWYEMWSGLPLATQEGESVTMTTTEADFLTLIRAGAIIALQKDTTETSEQTRLQSDYSITIALDCLNSTETTNSNTNTGAATNCTAEGSLYIAENITINFEANSEELTIKTDAEDLKYLCNFQLAISARRIKEIYIYGLNEDQNNYDHHRHVQMNIDLCLLEFGNDIVINFSAP